MNRPTDDIAGSIIAVEPRRGNAIALKIDGAGLCVVSGVLIRNGYVATSDWVDEKRGTK